MATTYRIHPAIGIARLGNSDEFFIGPERLGERPDPAGGFKDARCRVKRQAARFRIFAHNDDGSVQEITGADADITWTVHLANKKAAYPGRGNTESASDLTIDPGTRTTNGPDQRQVFDTGVIRFAGQPVTTVPLGEMRTDDQNHLLVLGGAGTSASPGGNGIGSFWGNPGWYDDVSDGPVEATIKLRSTGATPPVTGAWVICPPPKFAPHQDSPTTLYDRIFQAMVDMGFATAPTSSSYTKDIYPILQRARDIRWVYQTSAHSWADPVMAPADRSEIFTRLRPPPGDMPLLNASDSQLTPVQYAHMQRWNDDTNFTNDWSGIPPPEPTVTPSGMDRAALEACVGGAFFPGIEAGGLDAGNRPILAPANYAEAFRINHATVVPGTITSSMALPWQADFNACASQWWPVPRPNYVIPQGTSTYQNWSRGVGSYADMVAKWSTLGFVVKQGSQHVEVERCDTATITLLTAHLNFVDIPQGPMGMVREQPLAITFEVISPTTAVTLEYASGGAPAHPQLVAANTSNTVGPTSGTSVATARLWVIYRTGAAPSAIPTQTVTVREPVSGQTWTVTIDGNTIARKTAAVALALDRSGSMADDRGDGVSKHASLQQAAAIFVDVMLEGDGIGLVRYDQDAQVVQSVVALGSGGLSDINRNNTIDLINGNSFDPAGSTSIGDGIYEARQILDAAAGFDVKALAVLTDGVENSPRYIADVAAEINEQTYAIGFGTPQNTSAAALQAISGNHGGFLLITGAIGTDNRFLLQKYFLQILAGVSNAETVLDPDGELTVGEVHSIPFQLTDADSGVDVILLSPAVKAIDFRLQSPNGMILEPWRAMAEPAMRYILGNGVSYYRLVLPTQLAPGRFDQEGTWHALLTVGEPRSAPTHGDEHGVDRSILRGMHAGGARRRPSSRPEVMNEQQRRFAVAQGAAGAAMPAIAGDVVGRAAATRQAIPYSLLVHGYSNVSLRAELHQSGYAPGAKISVRALLTSSGLPLQGDAAVWAELDRPDRSRGAVDFTSPTPGTYEADFAAMSPGIHKLRVRARGHTRLGIPFVRERTLTAAVWVGGNSGDPQDPGGHRSPGTPGCDDELWGLLKCLLASGAVTPELERLLASVGFDLGRALKCLEVVLGKHRSPQAR